MEYIEISGVVELAPETTFGMLMDVMQQLESLDLQNGSFFATLTPCWWLEIHVEGVVSHTERCERVITSLKRCITKKSTIDVVQTPAEWTRQIMLRTNTLAA